MKENPAVAAYIRVSKDEINPENQRIALNKFFKRKSGPIFNGMKMFVPVWLTKDLLKRTLLPIFVTGIMILSYSFLFLDLKGEEYYQLSSFSANLTIGASLTSLLLSQLILSSPHIRNLLYQCWQLCTISRCCKSQNGQKQGLNEREEMEKLLADQKKNLKEVLRLLDKLQN